MNTTVMQEKVVEILVYLIGELRKNKPIGEIDLSVLSKRGYTAAEISAAFNWVYDKISMGDELVTDEISSTGQSFRILHDAERMAISPAAQGYLMQLREIGLISDNDIEAVIDRVMMSGYVTVGVEEMKTLVAMTLSESDDSQSTGSRIMLNSKDTIH
ncbi:MAG: DUF494 family protein [Acidobacteriota bacterium]